MMTQPTHRITLGTLLLWQLCQPGVYLIRDGDDRLIYVGSSRSLGARIFSSSHKMADWLTDESGTTIELEVYDDEATARAREDELIQRFKPKHNVAGRCVDDRQGVLWSWRA